MKRTMSIILSVAMLLMLLTFAASAAIGQQEKSTGISFAFADINGPVVGEKPSYDPTYGGRGYVLDAANNNPNYYKNGVGWYDVTDGKNIRTTDTFVAGHEYRVMIFFRAVDDYFFTENVQLVINDVDAVVTRLSETSVIGEISFPKLPVDDLPIKNPFSDVKETDFFYDAVLWAVDYGITTGTGPITFSPYDNCTRAQVVTFLWRSAGSPMPHVGDNPFTDVSSDAYYYHAVLWAIENKITSGVSATSFAPEASCTRGQIVTFLYRFIGG